MQLQIRFVFLFVFVAMPNSNNKTKRVGTSCVKTTEKIRPSTLYLVHVLGGAVLKKHRRLPRAENHRYCPIIILHVLVLAGPVPFVLKR